MAAVSVLLVLDDADEAYMYSVGLELRGFDCATVTTRSAPAAPGASVDVVVVDDGAETAGPAWDTLQRYCELPAGPPVVLLTAFVRSDRTTRDKLARIGCAAFVAKPCPPDRLASILWRVLAGERGIEETAADEDS